MTHATTPNEKLALVANQLLQIQNGDKAGFDCPYCAGSSLPGFSMCCKIFTKALEALLESQDLAERIKFTERIMDANLVN